MLRWLAGLCVALILAGCGSSDEKSESTESTSTGAATTATTSTTGTEAIDRMPEVPAATESTQPPASPHGTGGQAFLREVFADAQAMWRREFEHAGQPYAPATLTFFHDKVDTACGPQSVDVGPFYCPADHGVYMNDRFIDALSRRAGIRLGDFAQAFVVAHEVAHHIQTLVGTIQRVHAEDERDPAGKRIRSVRLELQADCYAGIWKHTKYQRGRKTRADLRDALNAAAVVGDDFGRPSGTLTPEDWSHGTSAQRQQWLAAGFEQGRPAACDTFAAA